MIHVRSPRATRPLVLVGSEGNTISGWEIGDDPMCTLVLQAQTPEFHPRDTQTRTSGSDALLPNHLHDTTVRRFSRAM